MMLMRKKWLSALAIALVSVCMGTSCATSDATLKEAGRSDAYIQGFHDGRHSGMKEAGNYLEHIVKDTQRFQEDADYRNGWIAGEEEGIRMQQQANAASGIYTNQQVEKEVKKSEADPDAIARDVMKDVDTSTLKGLEKD